MLPNILPSSKLLNHLFLYNAETGVLLWKNPRSNSVKVGDIAGSVNSTGYISTMISGKNYLNHRLIFKMFYDADPISELDHINRDPLDNRISNLRESTHSENQRNQSKSIKNKTGCTGVCFRIDGRKKQWCAQIANNEGKLISKCFYTLFDAACWRKSKEIEFEYTNG